RHAGDLAIVTDGPDAAEWLTIAQAFAGPAGTGRTAGQFA
ncbi:wyosine base formation domain-containing protein, partial [Nocardia gipuzkoensis]